MECTAFSFCCGGRGLLVGHRALHVVGAILERLHAVDVATGAVARLIARRGSGGEDEGCHDQADHGDGGRRADDPPHELAALTASDLLLVLGEFLLTLLLALLLDGEVDLGLLGGVAARSLIGGGSHA